MAKAKTKDDDPYKLGISPEGCKIFEEIKAIYSDTIFVPLDYATLAIYSESCARLRACNEEVQGRKLFYQTESGNFAAHPIRDEISMLQKQIHYCADKLGLTPTARHRLKLERAELAKSETTTGRKPNRKPTDDELRDAAESEFI